MEPAGRSAGEREYSLLVAELNALDEDIRAARGKAAALDRRAGLHLHAPERGAPPAGEHVALADGGAIVIRPIGPGDREAFASAYAQLGALSVVRRFGGRPAHVGDAELDELTDVDHLTHEALVALDVPDGELIGVARFRRSAGDPTTAEFTCTVMDPWQGCGVGTALVERLAARARAVGVERFTAVTVVGNEPARGLLRHVASGVTEHREGGLLEMDARPR